MKVQGQVSEEEEALNEDGKDKTAVSLGKQPSANEM